MTMMAKWLQARTLKLLQLTRLLVPGVQLPRREAWLASLVTDLVTHLGSADLASPRLVHTESFIIYS